MMKIFVKLVMEYNLKIVNNVKTVTIWTKPIILVNNVVIIVVYVQVKDLVIFVN